MAWAASLQEALTSARLRPILGPNTQTATSSVSSRAIGAEPMKATKSQSRVVAGGDQIGHRGAGDHYDGQQSHRQRPAHAGHFLLLEDPFADQPLGDVGVHPADERQAWPQQGDEGADRDGDEQAVEQGESDGSVEGGGDGGGARVRRQEAVHGGQRDRHRQSHPEQVGPGDPDEREGHGDDDDEGDLVEHRHADEHRGQHHGDLHPAWPAHPEEPAGDPLRGAGVAHHPPDHGAESDGEHGVADLVADALGEDVRDVPQAYPLDQRDTHGDQEEGDEAVQSQLRHQKEQNEEWTLVKPLLALYAGCGPCASWRPRSGRSRPLVTAGRRRPPRRKSRRPEGFHPRAHGRVDPRPRNPPTPAPRAPDPRTSGSGRSDGPPRHPTGRRPYERERYREAADTVLEEFALPVSATAPSTRRAATIRPGVVPAMARNSRLRWAWS